MLNPKNPVDLADALVDCLRALAIKAEEADSPMLDTWARLKDEMSTLAGQIEEAADKAAELKE